MADRDGATLFGQPASPASFGSSMGDGTGAHTVYAGFWPSGSIPGHSAVPGTSQAGDGSTRRYTERDEVKTREGVFGAILENWLPFSAWIYDRFIGPRRPIAPWQSPYDLGQGDAIQRQGPFPSGQRPFPYPYEIGAVSGFMPMLDAYSMSWSWGKTPSGPGVLTPIPIPWQASYPNLQKVTG